MVKNKQYIKLDLRKQKNTNHRTLIVKKDKNIKVIHDLDDEDR